MLVYLIGFIISCLMTLLNFFALWASGSNNVVAHDGATTALPVWFGIALFCAIKLTGG